MVAEDLVRVGVIEDHPLYRAAVARVLADAPDLELDAVAESVAQFAARRSGPGGVVVLDLRLRGVRDAAAVMEVVALGHKVLVLSAHARDADVLGAMAAGARGYLSKESDGAEIVRAVREIAVGNSYVSPTLASAVLTASRRERNTGPVFELSERERQVLALLAAGARDQDIAEAMAISIRTVRSYLDRIRDKTGWRRRPELTRFAIEEGLAYQARTA